MEYTDLNNYLSTQFSVNLVDTLVQRPKMLSFSFRLSRIHRFLSPSVVHQFTERIDLRGFWKRAGNREKDLQMKRIRKYSWKNDRKWQDPVAGVVGGYPNSRVRRCRETRKYRKGRLETNGRHACLIPVPEETTNRTSRKHRIISFCASFSPPPFFRHRHISSGIKRYHFLCYFQAKDWRTGIWSNISASSVMTNNICLPSKHLPRHW